MRNIVILISGGGSNMAAIVQASRREAWEEKYQAHVACVISNRGDAKGLRIAQEQGIETDVIDHNSFASRQAFESALADRISVFERPDFPVLVVLAGFMRILTSSFTNRFSPRILNIHPSLLPAFPGLHTHQRAIDAGCKYAGATVHVVTPALDHGPIVDQIVVPVMAQDTAQTLASRVLTQEHLVYPRAIERWLAAESLQTG